MNLVIFGESEDNYTVVWRRSVDCALETADGNVDDVIDIFRLERFSDGKWRSVLMELRTTWDKRLLLMNCHELKNSDDRVFIAADEPVEERCRKTMERIKYHAEQDGKNYHYD